MDFQFDYSLGREVEFYNRVNDNDPTNAVFVMRVIASGHGLDADDLRGVATMAALLALVDEVTNTNYTAKTITDANIAAYTVDTTQHRIGLTLPVQTWSNPAAGDAWDAAVVGYDSDSTAGDDTNIIPISWHELRLNEAALVPNGSPIVVDLSGGWLTARQ